jgi:hypothetical protein
MSQPQGVVWWLRQSAKTLEGRPICVGWKPLLMPCRFFFVIEFAGVSYIPICSGILRVIHIARLR